MTEFTQTLRHYCRNPRCRSKLPSPASDPRKAFCTRGCHSSFYLKRCVVCEAPFTKTRANQEVCRKARCRRAFREANERFRYLILLGQNPHPPTTEHGASWPARN